VKFAKEEGAGNMTAISFRGGMDSVV